MPVAEAAADNCALFLWAIDPLLPRAIELIRAWGFEYKTVAFYWVKLNSSTKHSADFFTGLGYWTRANPEQCLLATLGKPMRHAKDFRRLIVENVASTAESRIVCGNKSNALFQVHISNCLHVRLRKAGTAGAINLDYSTQLQSRHAGSHPGWLTFHRYYCDAHELNGRPSLSAALDARRGERRGASRFAEGFGGGMAFYLIRGMER